MLFHIVDSIIVCNMFTAKLIQKETASVARALLPHIVHLMPTHVRFGIGVHTQYAQLPGMRIPVLLLTVVVKPDVLTNARKVSKLNFPSASCCSSKVFPGISFSGTPNNLPYSYMYYSTCIYYSYNTQVLVSDTWNARVLIVILVITCFQREEQRYLTWGNHVTFQNK